MAERSPSDFDPYLAVRAFHERFGVARADRPRLQSPAVHALRARMLREEVEEVAAALAGTSLAEIAHELVGQGVSTAWAAYASGKGSEESQNRARRTGG